MLDPPMDRDGSDEMKARARAIARLCPLVAALGAACSSNDAKTTDTTPYSRDRLLNPETCKDCHADHYKEWSGSMHAYASTDPIFRAMNARGQRETKGELG